MATDTSQQLLKDLLDQRRRLLAFAKDPRSPHISLINSQLDSLNAKIAQLRLNGD